MLFKPVSVSLIVLALAGVAAAQSWRQPCEWVTDEECRPLGRRDDGCAVRSPGRRPAPPNRAPRDQPPAAAPVERSPVGGVVLHAVLCGVSYAEWAGLVGQASGVVTAAGGRPFLLGRAIEGCPRSFAEIGRQRSQLPAGGLYFAVYPAGRAVPAICGGGAVGCAQLGGNLGFVSLAREWWDNLTLAHETGHMFGLDHSSDPHDLMFPSVESNRITASRAYVRAQARWGGAVSAYQGPPRVVR